MLGTHTKWSLNIVSRNEECDPIEAIVIRTVTGKQSQLNSMPLKITSEIVNAINPSTHYISQNTIYAAKCVSFQCQHLCPVLVEHILQDRRASKKQYLSVRS